MREAKRFFGWASGGSIVVHGAIIVSLVVASYLRLEPLAQPRLTVRLFVPVAPAPPSGTPSSSPPSAGAAAPKARATPKADVAPRPEPEPLQPQQPSEAPPPNELPPGDGASDEQAGGETGDGVPGGTGPGYVGVPWGVTGGGGPPWGPGDVLDGLRDEQPVYLTSEVTPPEKTTHVNPVYPETARVSRSEGAVILQIVIGRDGSVEKVTVIKADPLFEAAALDAVRRWKYRPAMYNGRPVRVYQTVRIVFTLK